MRNTIQQRLVLGAVFAGAVGIGVAGMAQAQPFVMPTYMPDPPAMQVAVHPEAHGSTLTIESQDAAPFTIRQVILNNRAGQQDCDLPEFGRDPKKQYVTTLPPSMETAYGTKLPVTLKRGTRAMVVSDCGEIRTADVQTDKGHMEFQFPSSVRPKGKGDDDDD